MIIRIQGPTDRRKIEADERESLRKVIETNYNITKFRVSFDKARRKAIDASKTMEQLGLESGAMLFLEYDSKKVTNKDSNTANNSVTKPGSSQYNTNKVIKKRTSLLCNHSKNAMCAHCAPLDPWDASYHSENKIKYLSFNSYKEMLKINKKTFETVNYKKKKCQDHGPRTSCTKCQLMPITLCPQVFRVIDHVEFDCGVPVEMFIKNCKTSGRSRFGYLIGKYEEYNQVPLGRKAVASWIYEPNQQSFPDGFILCEDENLSFAQNFGMQIVGMIYYATGDRDFFLSSMEIEFIANFQLNSGALAIPNSNTRLNSASNVSCFVTIVIRTNEDNEYVLDEFMVSEQCKALVKENIIVPTIKPHLFLANEDIRYMSENKLIEDKYIPGDFFIVKLTHGMKYNPFFLSKKRFDTHSGLKKISDYFNKTFDIETFSNYDLVLKLSSEMDVTKLIEAVRYRDENSLKEFVGGKEFSEFRTRFKQYEVENWNCKTCTYLNTNNLSECEICGFQK